MQIPSMSTWDSETRNPDRTITIDEGVMSPSQLQFSPDGTKLLANSGYNIYIIDFATGKILDNITAFETTSYSASFYGDGDMVAYGDGKLVKIYSLADKKITHTLTGHKDEVLCVYGYKTDRDNLFTSDFKMSVISWNVNSESMRCSKPIKMKIPPYKMKYNPGDNRVYIGGAGSGMFLMHPDYFSFEPRTAYESTSNTGYPQIFDFNRSNTAYIQSVEGGEYITVNVKE
jgi:WD40 repeat protein